MADVALRAACAQSGRMHQGVASANSWEMQLPSCGLSVMRKVFAPGVTETKDVPCHTISLHAGAPVRTSCVRSGRSYVAQLTRGDIDIVPKGEGGVWVDEGPAEALILRIDSGFVNKVAAGLGLDASTLEVLARVQVRDPQLEHLGWALEAALVEDKPVEQLYMQGLGIALATRLIKEHSAVRPARIRRALSRRQTNAVCDHIEANLAGSLSLATLAPVAGVSPSHFKTLFKAAVGVPAHRYVMRRRVARAAELIKTRSMPLTQVALESGFAHQSHMARAMRSVLGCTPGELAREYR